MRCDYLGKILYISDLHLGHANVIRFDGRPYQTVQEMDEDIIKRWNETVSDDDTVYILGDFCWGKEKEWLYYLKQMSGKKVLIRGNHDLVKMSAQLRRHFQDVKDYLEIKDNGRNVILCHYPMPFYKRSYFEGMYMLYGHVHVTREDVFLNEWKKTIRETRSDAGHARGQFYNVGCMKSYMDYRPRTLDEILAANP